jgi:hypothetical protein
VAVSIVKLKRAAEYELQTARPRLSFLQPTEVQQDPALHGDTSFFPSGFSNQAYKAILKFAVRILSWNGEVEYAVHPAGLFYSCLYHLTMHVRGTQINDPNSKSFNNVLLKIFRELQHVKSSVNVYKTGIFVQHEFSYIFCEA